MGKYNNANKLTRILLILIFAIVSMRGKYPDTYAQSPCPDAVDRDLLTTEAQEATLRAQNINITERFLMVSGAEIGATLNPRQGDLWSFWGEEGAIMSITIDAGIGALYSDANFRGEFIPRITFLDKDGEELAFNEEGGGAAGHLYFGLWGYVLPMTGNYVLIYQWVDDGSSNASSDQLPYSVEFYWDENVIPPNDILPPDCLEGWQALELDLESPALFASGEWVEQSSEFAFDGEYIYTVDAGAGILFDFEGNQLLLQYLAFSNFGIFEIYLDGELLDTIDSYSPESDVLKTITYEFEAGNHQLAIRNTGERNPDSTDSVMAIDAIAVRTIGDDSLPDDPIEEASSTPDRVLIAMGYAFLDGRDQNDGILIQLLQKGEILAETITDEEGYFELELENEPIGDFQLRASFPTYLPLDQTFNAQSGLLQDITGFLPGGDLTNDEVVDIDDVIQMGLLFGMEGENDLTGNGIFDLDDLVLLSLSYGKQGEQRWVDAE